MPLRHVLLPWIFSDFRAGPDYRFGFIYLSDDAPRGVPPHWVKRRCGPATLLTHPETPVAFIDDAIILGHCFSTHPWLDVTALVQSIPSDPHALDYLSGRFALIKNGRVYHDAFGARSVFYRESCVASHSGLLAQIFQEGPDALATAIRDDDGFRSRTVKYLPGDLSPHNNVRALIPNNCYDLGAQKPIRYWPRHEMKPATAGAFYRCADEYFDGMASFLRAQRLRPILGVTSGIDSRGIIAAFRRRKLQMQYVTWSDLGFHPKDRPITEETIGYLGGDHLWMQAFASHDDPAFANMRRAAACNNGHFRGGSRLTANMARAFPGKYTFVRGYGGEILRGFYNIGRRPLRSATVSELVRGYNSSMKGEASAHYLALVAEAVEGFMLRGAYAGIEGFGYDLNDIYYWEQRMGMWGSAMLNEMDPAMLALAGYNSRRLYEAAFGIDPKERLTKNFLLELLRRDDEGLASVAVL